MQLMNSQIQNMQMKNDAHPNPERRCYTVDELTQIPARRVLSALTMLELDGYVAQSGGKRFSIQVELKE